MNLIWEDIINDKEEWTGLRLDVKEKTPARLKLESGDNTRFKIYNGEHPVLWGTFGAEYWGVWALRNKNNWESKDMPIPPIHSSDIERSRDNDHYSFWSRFFAKELMRKGDPRLSQGLWTLTIGASPKQRLKNSTLFVYDIEHVFEKNNPRFIEWDIGHSYSLVSIKEEPNTENGRVKWFRKLVREESCPPVLIWHLHCIDGYIILDGHCRLKAFQLEDTPIEFIVLNAVRKEKHEKDAKVQKNILYSLEQRQENAKKSTMTVDQVNQLLIAAFDDRPFYRPITNATAKHDYDATWTQEVWEIAETLGIEKTEIEYMIEREDF